MTPEVAGLHSVLGDICIRRGFQLLEQHPLRLTEAQAARFLSHRSGDSDYKRHLAHLASGPVMALVLKRAHCLRALQQLVSKEESVEALVATGWRGCRASEGWRPTPPSHARRL